jgi:hypothetical protein
VGRAVDEHLLGEMEGKEEGLSAGESGRSNSEIEFDPLYIYIYRYNNIE